MTNYTPFPTTLDPWAASSLLQKAIRRSEAELAIVAARALYGYRGKAIWKRLLTIAVEDVGIANPDLLWEVARLGGDTELRFMLGTDIEVIEDLCRKLAESAKDRSADYLSCSAVRLPECGAHREWLAKVSWTKQLEIVTDRDQPTLRRAVAALQAVTRDGFGNETIKGAPLREFLAMFQQTVPRPLLDAVSAYSARGGHPFSLMLPILWCELAAPGAVTQSINETVPEAKCASGIPLYTFDKHTASGKRAINHFAQANPNMVRVLEPVPLARRGEVALMAAFYADATPIAHRFVWSQSYELERMGRAADMGWAGCPASSVTAVLDCVRDNLADLDRFRMKAFAR